MGSNIIDGSAYYFFMNFISFGKLIKIIKPSNNIIFVERKTTFNYYYGRILKLEKYIYLCKIYKKTISKLFFFSAKSHLHLYIVYINII